ncbi:hypothetical protein RT97_06395 [Variovorax paradoxus]|uniref:Uncharacterized protein n=1 Tax=Variovorax paradoxus TaxID=34073 RepID=A0A0D0MVG5_VARPD|nr:hypothetical protein [Variovorax paradoxus]KIQ34874.1 hypothetical protein RT97_06395 [Variovorax paradoxus]
MTSKEERERLVFEHFARTAGLLPGGSFASRPPPEPDILYVGEDGAFASFELVEIVDRDYSASVGQSLSTKGACYEFLDGMTPVNAAAFREAFSNADIALDFTSGMSGQRRKNALPSIFQYLMRLPPGFEGDAFSDSNPLGTVISYLHVSRGAFVGPLFDASSAVWVGDPSVDALASKMSKTYKPQGQISLLAYIDGNPMFPDEIWLADLDEYLATLDDRCQFERMFVYDCGRDCIMRTWTRPPAQQAAP